MFRGDLTDLGDGGGREGIVSGAVEFARQAMGGLKQGLDGRRFEDGQRATGALLHLPEVNALPIRCLEKAGRRIKCHDC